MRRLERQHLALLAQRLLDLGERRGRARRDHELGGLVCNDAAAGGHIEHLAVRLPP
jgi:hypothetical protein